MLWLFEKLKEEQRVISAARWSFLTACIAVTVFIWGGFDYFYRGKLADSDRHANQWKSDAEYWKDVAEHPKKAEITGNAQQPLVEPQGRPKQTKQKKSPIVLPPGTSITATTAAPDSAAVRNQYQEQ